METCRFPSQIPNRSCQCRRRLSTTLGRYAFLTRWLLKQFRWWRKWSRWVWAYWEEIQPNRLLQWSVRSYWAFQRCLGNFRFTEEAVGDTKILGNIWFDCGVAGLNSDEEKGREEQNEEVQGFHEISFNIIKNIKITSQIKSLFIIF